MLKGVSAFLESERMIAEKQALRNKSIVSFGARRVLQMEEEDAKLTAIPNIINYLTDKEYDKEQNRINYNNREEVMRLKKENLESSVLVCRLGMAQPWKPDKVSFLSERKNKSLFS